MRLAPQKKYLEFPFPKSRRLVTVNGKHLPMGWARLSFTPKADLEKQEENERSHTILQQKKAEEAKQQAEKISTEQDLANFKHRVSECRNLPGEIDDFIQQVKRKEKADVRKKMIEALLAQANSLGKKKKFSKALKDDKKWALKLKDLCEENDVSLPGPN